VLIVGCEASEFDPENGMSPVVRRAIDDAVDVVVNLIASVAPPRVAAEV
jgi:hypothetical protein